MGFERTSSTWRAVEARLTERRAALVAECISVATPADRRAELAARIAEVDSLLDMPDELLRAGQMAMLDPDRPRSY